MYKKRETGGIRRDRHTQIERMRETDKRQKGRGESGRGERESV